MDGYRALAMAYQRKGWLQKALEMNQKTMVLEPDDTTALGGIGWVNVKSFHTDIFPDQLATDRIV